MQALKGFGLKALELPTDPLTGINLEALEMALGSGQSGHPAHPDLQQPARLRHAQDQSRALLELAQRYDLAIIEDDIYGDLVYRYPRPRTIVVRRGRPALLCSSFSATLVPGLRIG